MQRPKWCPTRLLDIGLEGNKWWKLCLSEDFSSPPNYITLSYRWGSSPSITLSHSNIEEFRRGKLISDLPRTFRDSVVVARRFSIRYLWIDSLCILQDSSEDWKKEFSTMRHVYTNASCNISATASIGPQGGLFRQRKSEDIQPGLFKTQTDSTEKWYLMCDSAYWDRHVSNTPLHRRGWVFQERLLSPRVLHFTEKQIFWECFTDQKCELYPLGIPQNRSLKTFGPLFEPDPPPYRENVATRNLERAHPGILGVHPDKTER